MEVRLDNVRMAFVNIFEPKQVNNEGEPKYTVTALLPKGSPQLEIMEKAMKEVAREKWPKEAARVYKALVSEAKTCLRDGDNKNYGGFENHMYVSASSKVRPLIMDMDKTKLTNADAARIYSGCYGYVLLDVWAQDNQHGKRINAVLKGVMKAADGEAFTGGAPATEADFADIEVPEGEEATAEDFNDLL